VLVVAVVIHVIGVLIHLEEPRIVELWLTRARNCPRVKNYRIWRCNSYRA
jgi:type IV secretion system protein VirB3